MLRCESDKIVYKFQVKFELSFSQLLSTCDKERVGVCGLCKYTEVPEKHHSQSMKQYMSTEQKIGARQRVSTREACVGGFPVREHTE